MRSVKLKIRADTERHVHVRGQTTELGTLKLIMARRTSIPRNQPKAKGGSRSGKSNSASDRSFEATKRASHAIARVRHDRLSPSAAASEEGTTFATMRKYFPGVFRRSKTGKWIVTRSDLHVRFLSLPGPHGPVTVPARGSQEARFASAYLASLARWRHNEKAYELAPFHRKKIGDFELITAPRTLRALRDAGLLQLDSLYAALKDTV
jgi:hypothetical protein